MSSVDLEDVVEALEDIRDALKKQPKLESPVVNVSPAQVSVAAPVVNVPERRQCAYDIEVLERNSDGQIKRVRLTPI